MSNSHLLPVVPVGQGTWQMESDDPDAAIAALRRGVELGLTHVDTAEMYGSGAVERLVGRALGPLRDQVFLASKVLPDNASRAGTIAACERSLRRLGTDRLDLYMLHWPGSHPLEDTFAAFEELRAQGKILRWGVSNFDVPEMEAALRCAGPGRIACNQVLYHLEERAIEHRLIPWCRDHGVPVVAYSPFGAGRFPTPRSPRGQALAEVASKHGATARQVALAFLLRQPGVVTIPKAAQRAHVEENAGAVGLALEADDVARLEAAFPRGKAGRLPWI
jgi:diketogulonate reductase-like aldo/keto reductase